MTEGEPLAPRDFPGPLVLALHRLSWQASRRRGGYFAQDRLAAAMVERATPGELLVVDHPQSLAGAARRRRRAVPGHVPPGTHHYAPLRLRRTDPTSVRTAAAANAVLGRRIGAAASRNRLLGPSLLTTNPVLAGFGELSWASSVAYYATDDFAAGEEDRALGGVYTAAYDAIRDRGVRVAAVSSTLLDTLAPSGRSAVVPNGIDPEEWRSEAPPPSWFSSAATPRLLYLGGLDRRIDIGLIERLARALPSASLTFVGHPIDRVRVEALRAIPNVAVRAPVDRASVVALIKTAQVGLVPHAVTRGTRAMSPLKVFEYLAGGLPVVATDLPEAAQLSSRVWTAPNADDFIRAVSAALEVPAPERSALERYRHANSWASRHDMVLDLLR